MMEFTEQEVTDIYNRLGLVSVVMGLDMDHEDIEHCGRVLCGMVEHPIFLTGRGILFTYNYNTRHITIYDNIIGSPGKFIISCSEIHPNKVADSREEIAQALEKLMKDLYFYQKLNAEIDISDALSVLEGEFMAIDDLKTKINELTSESELRELRNCADTRLQSLKEAKEMENKSEHENRYKDKYLLLYGRTVSMTHSEVNQNEMRIVHVEDINFVGRGFFRCKVKSIHINFDDEWKKIAHLTGEWGSAYVSYTVDDNFDLREEDIDEIISKERAMELVANAKEDFDNIITTWDI